MNTEQSRKSKSGLRQILMLVAPAVALAANVIFPWSDVAARIGGDYIYRQHTFVDIWQGQGALVVTILGVLVGAALVLVKDMDVRRKLTVCSLFLALILTSLCAAFQATMPQSDPLMAVAHKGTTLYMGLGMGLHLTEALGIAWFFAALSAWSWKRTWGRKSDQSEE